MDTGSAILLLLASQSFTATFGLVAENRTGQRPLFVGGEDELVTEFELSPRGTLDIRLKRSGFNFFYSPRAYSRINFESENNTLRPLLLHSFGAGFDHGFTRRLRFSFSVSGSVGEVDYSNIDLVQGTTQVVPGGEAGDPRISAAPSLPENQDTFSTQDYAARLGLTWNFARNHTLSIGAGGHYNASLGNDEVFPDNYGGAASLGWSWQFDPNYGFNLDASYGENRVDPTLGSTGEFRSINLGAGFGAAFTRFFNSAISAGVLLADNQPVVREGLPPPDSGISASPTGNLSFTFIPTSGRGDYHLTTTFGAGVEGFIDPLAAQGFVPRLALNWSLGFIFFDDWSFGPSASFFTPLSAPPPGQMDSLNETLVSFSIPLAYQITRELGMSIGLRVSGRGDNLRRSDPQFGDWFLLGFLSFNAGVTTRL